MRLIDADALDTLLKDAQTVCKRNRDNFRFGVLNNIRGNIAKMPTVGGWISVKDMLPEEDVEVLVARYMTKNGKKKPYVETASQIGGQWFSYTDEWKLNKTAHSAPFAWMPLPEPPKE